MTKNNINNEIQENKYSNFIIEEDESDDTCPDNLNSLFTSSESSDSIDSIESIEKNKTKIQKNIGIDTNLNQYNSSNNKIKNATTGIDIFDNDVPEFINNDENIKTIFKDYNLVSTSYINPPNSPIEPKNIKPKNEDINKMVENMLSNDDKNINGWDSDANITINNWYKIFKQQSFIYQFVLDKNREMADILAIISIISSALLGIFSGFKLWIDNDIIFQTVSNILLMLLNFLVALITASSKRYIDDKNCGRSGGSGTDYLIELVDEL